jgi:Big-like domain-containing protein
MKAWRTRARHTRHVFNLLADAIICFIFVAFAALTASAQTTDTIPPSPPIGLIATAATCGQVDLSWGASTDNVGGSGMKAYIIWRNNDGVNTVTAIGSARTTFSDTIYVKSSDTLTYYVVAQDNAGNNSLPSNTVTVITPACPMSLGEQVVDSTYSGPLGKSMATYGTRSAVIYQKSNIYSTRDTWLHVYDSDTGATSNFLLHSYPGYSQVETDYLLSSATGLWTLSYDSGSTGKLLVSQYQLNGSPPTSATLLSTKSLGDNYSVGMSMVLLKSGAIVAAWSDMSLFGCATGSCYTGDLIAGYAYRNPTGAWTVYTPATLASSGGSYIPWKTRMAMAQHPVDSSVWLFVKEDTSSAIEALHFTESSSGFSLDWVNASFISQSVDGINGPEGEFPYLTALPDPTRNAILLGYQDEQYQFVFVDPLYGSMSNNIFLKQAYVSIAQIAPDGSKLFIPFPYQTERITLFGMSVLSDGTIWLAYQPINSQTLTWNEVFASSYQSGVWGAPAPVGLDYNNYNNASGLDISLVYRADQPLVDFRTPDKKIHAFDLSRLGPAPADTTPPTTFITSPASGATVSGTVSVSASASDNVGVTSVQLLVDGVLAGTATAAPYSFSWNTTTLANGSHTLQAQAYDAAGNVGLSSVVTVTVSNLTASSLTVAVTNPKNGGTVPRNQNVTVSASATDNSIVTRVDFYINSKLLGSTTTAPYNYPWKVPAKNGASYNVQARAYDALGNNAAQTILVTAQ